MLAASPLDREPVMPASRPLRLVALSLALLGAAAAASSWAPSLCAQEAPAGPPAPAGDEAAPTGEPGPFRPVARVSSLMTGFASAFSEVRQAHGRTDDEHRLRAVRSHAEVLAELSNVHGRHDRKPDYLQRAAATRDLALDLARAAKASTPDEALLAGLIGRIDASCAACHDAEQ